MKTKSRAPRFFGLWLCRECIREGRSNPYNSIERKVCPWGHKRKTLR